MSLGLSAQKLKNEKFGFYTYVQTPANDVLEGKKYYLASISLLKEDAFRERAIAEGLELIGYEAADHLNPAHFEVLVTEHRSEFGEAEKQSKKEEYKDDGVTKTRYQYWYTSNMKYHFSIKILDVDRNELFRDDLKGSVPIKGPSSTSVERAYRLYRSSQDDFKANLAPNQAKFLSEYFNEHFATMNKTVDIRAITVKAKKFEYPNFDKGFKGLQTAYNVLSVKDQHTDESTQGINDAIEYFNKVLDEAQPADKKARVNSKVTAAAHYNLGLAYFLDYQFTLAQQHFENARLHEKWVINEIVQWVDRSKYLAEREANKQ